MDLDDRYYWNGPLPETQAPASTPEPWGDTKVVGKPVVRVDAYDRVSGSAVYPVRRDAARHAARRRAVVPARARAHHGDRYERRREDAGRARRAQGRRARDQHPVVRRRRRVQQPAVRSALPHGRRRSGGGRRRHHPPGLGRGARHQGHLRGAAARRDLRRRDEGRRAADPRRREQGAAAESLPARRCRRGVQDGRRGHRAHVHDGHRAAEPDGTARVRGEVGRPAPDGLGIDAGRVRRAEQRGARASDCRWPTSAPSATTWAAVSAPSSTPASTRSSPRSWRRKTGRPVRLFLSREQVILTMGNRPGNTIWVKAGAKKDGTLVALETKTTGSGGAYSGGGTGGVDYVFRELYLCPNVRCAEPERLHQRRTRASVPRARDIRRARGRSSRRWTSSRRNSAWIRSSSG